VSGELKRRHRLIFETEDSEGNKGISVKD